MLVGFCVLSFIIVGLFVVLEMLEILSCLKRPMRMNMVNLYTNS